MALHAIKLLQIMNIKLNDRYMLFSSINENLVTFDRTQYAVPRSRISPLPLNKDTYV